MPSVAERFTDNNLETVDGLPDLGRSLWLSPFSCRQHRLTDTVYIYNVEFGSDLYWVFSVCRIPIAIARVAPLADSVDAVVLGGVRERTVSDKLIN